MSIIVCPECGGKVSSNANSCPHCGNTVLYETDSTLIGCGIILFFVILSAVYVIISYLFN